LSGELQISQVELRETFKQAPGALRERAGRCGPLTTLRYAACLAETLLDDTLSLARERKSQGKVLLTYQAVALRVANLYLALLGLEQALDDAIATGGALSPERRRHGADLLLSVLRNAAQVLAGHGFIDNPRFEALHQSALDTVRDLNSGAQA
jgi:alkylation response protein AidB-like acyl-CoA dehydrogenase